MKAASMELIVALVSVIWGSSSSGVSVNALQLNTSLPAEIPPSVFPEDVKDVKIVGGSAGVEKPPLIFPEDSKKFKILNGTFVAPVYDPPNIFPEDPSKFPIRTMNVSAQSSGTAGDGGYKQAEPLFTPPLEFPSDPSKYRIFYPKPQEPPLVFPGSEVEPTTTTKPKVVETELEDMIHESPPFEVVGVTERLEHVPEKDDKVLRVLPLGNPKLDIEMYQSRDAFVEKDSGRLKSVVELHSQVGKWLVTTLFLVVLISFVAYAAVVYWRKSGHGGIRRRILVNEEDFHSEVKYSEC